MTIQVPGAGGGAQPFESTRDMLNARRELHKRDIPPDTNADYVARLAVTPEWIIRGGARRGDSGGDLRRVWDPQPTGV